MQICENFKVPIAIKIPGFWIFQDLSKPKTELKMMK